MYQDNLKDRQGRCRTHLRAALVVFLSGNTGSLYAQTPMPRQENALQAQQVDVRVLPPLPVQVKTLRGVPEDAVAVTSVGTVLRERKTVEPKKHMSAIHAGQPRTIQPIPVHEDGFARHAKGQFGVIPASEATTTGSPSGSGHAHFTFSDQSEEAGSGDAGSYKQKQPTFSAQFSLTDRHAENSPRLAEPIGLDGFPTLPVEESPVLEPMSTPAALLRVAPRSPLVASSPIEFEAIGASDLPLQVGTQADAAELAPLKSSSADVITEDGGTEDSLEGTTDHPEGAGAAFAAIAPQLLDISCPQSPVNGEPASEMTAEAVGAEDVCPELPADHGAESVTNTEEAMADLVVEQAEDLSPFAKLEPVANSGMAVPAPAGEAQGIHGNSPVGSIADEDQSSQPTVARKNLGRQTSEVEKPASSTPIRSRGPFAEVIVSPVEVQPSEGQSDAAGSPLAVMPLAEIYRPKKSLVIDTATMDQSGDAADGSEKVEEEFLQAPAKLVSLVQIAETASVSPNEPVKKVQLVDREVCDAVLVSPYKLLLIGRKAGTTKLAIWYGENIEPEVREIRVVETQPTVAGASLDAVAKRLTESIAATYPGCSVSVVPVGEGLTVRGAASDSKSAKAIMRLVRSACLKTVNDQLEVR